MIGDRSEPATEESKAMVKLRAEAIFGVLILLQLVSQPFAAEGPAAAGPSARGDDVRLNQIQVIGTHKLVSHRSTQSSVGRDREEEARSWRGHWITPIGHWRSSFRVSVSVRSNWTSLLTRRRALRRAARDQDGRRCGTAP